jgi:hypothetical protein
VPAASATAPTGGTRSFPARSVTGVSLPVCGAHKTRRPAIGHMPPAEYEEVRYQSQETPVTVAGVT